MKPGNPSNLTRLRWSILLSLLLALLGGAAVILSVRLMNESRQDHSREQREGTAIEHRLAQLGPDGKLMERRLARYTELMDRGYIGPEQRLAWVEEIESTRRKLKLLELHYEFSPQQALDSRRSEGYDFWSSQMKLQMQMLHEEDLVNFLGDLRRRALAHLRINDCRIERLTGNATEGGLQAECSIDWITFKEKERP